MPQFLEGFTNDYAVYEHEDPKLLSFLRLTTTRKRKQMDTPRPIDMTFSTAIIDMFLTCDITCLLCVDKIIFLNSNLATEAEFVVEEELETKLHDRYFKIVSVSRKADTVSLELCSIYDKFIWVLEGSREKAVIVKQQLHMAWMSTEYPGTVRKVPFWNLYVVISWMEILLGSKEKVLFKIQWDSTLELQSWCWENDTLHFFIEDSESVYDYVFQK